MATAAGEGDGSNNTSSTVSTSSSAAAAAVSEASSSMSLPSLPSLSAALTNSFHLAHVTTLCPPSMSPSSAAAAVAAAASDGLVVVARPAAVSFHDASTMEATASTSGAEDAACGAGSVKCVAAAELHGGRFAAVTGHQDGRLRLWRASLRSPGRLRLAAALPTVSDRIRRFPVPSNHVAVRRHHRRLWIEHADAVSGIDASPDGRLLFSVSWDKTLKVWSVPSLRCVQSLTAHDDAVNAVAVAPDGAVYTASADRRVRVWAPADAAPRRPGKRPAAYHLVATLSRHAAAVNAVAVGCGGHVLYSGGNDRCVVTVRAWRRAADGGGYACVAVIDGHGGAVRSVAAAAIVPAQKKKHRAVDGDGEEWSVCSASFDGEVRLWSLRVAAAS
uniref:Uncharacterized protein n=1 Tax=Leersia perrieri TaxID=77586 RepID=A0A0D9W6B2_9ORYZ